MEKKEDNEGEDDEISKLKKNTNKKPEIPKEEKKLLKEDEKMAEDILDIEDLK